MTPHTQPSSPPGSEDAGPQVSEGFCTQPLILVYEFMDNGSLYQHLHCEVQMVGNCLTQYKNYLIIIIAVLFRKSKH